MSDIEDTETHEDPYIDALMLLRLQTKSAELLSGPGWSRQLVGTRNVLAEALTLLIEKKKKEYEDAKGQKT